MNNDCAPSFPEPVDQRRRWLRVLSILDACHWVGLTPITTSALHVIAYLSEALAPIWELEPMDGRVLKQSAAPYYPALQQDVDDLIAMGLIRVDDLQLGLAGDGALVLTPNFSLESKRVEPILTALRKLPGEERIFDFTREVVQAFSRLSDDQIPYSMDEDATYGDHAVDTGQVIDLGEWLSAKETPTSRAADQICQLSEDGVTPAEIIDMYVDHIAYRVSHG